MVANNEKGHYTRVDSVSSNSGSSSWRSVLDALAHINNNNNNKHNDHTNTRIHDDDDDDDDDDVGRDRELYTRVVRNHKKGPGASTSAWRGDNKVHKRPELAAEGDVLDRARFFSRQADAARSTVERLESRAAELARMLEERDNDVRAHAETVRQLEHRLRCVVEEASERRRMLEAQISSLEEQLSLQRHRSALQDERVRIIECERVRAEDRSRASDSASRSCEDRLASQECVNRDLVSELVALKESLSAAHALERSRAAAEDATERAREDNTRLLALLAATGEYAHLLREWEDFPGGATYLPHHAEYTSLVNTYHTDANALEHTRPVCAKREADEWVPMEGWSAAQAFARAHMSSSSHEAREALRDLVVAVSDCWRRAGCARARRDNERHRREVADLRRQIAHGVAYEEVVRPASSSSSLLASGAKRAGGSNSNSNSSNRAAGVFGAKTRQLAASVGNLSVVARAAQRMSEEVVGDGDGGGGGGCDDELACARVCGQLARKTAAATQDLINDVADILTQFKAKAAMSTAPEPAARFRSQLQLQSRFAEGLHGAVHRCYTQARAAYGAALESSGFDRDKAGRFAAGGRGGGGGGSVNITSNSASSKFDEGGFWNSGGHAGCAHDYACSAGANNVNARSTCTSPRRW